MALRIANKINRQALQNIRKSLCSGSSVSTCFPRSSTNDASSVTSTITSTCSTIHSNNNKTNLPPSANITVAPPTTPVSNPPPSATSMQCSPYSNQNNTPITIGTDEFPSQDLFDEESNSTRLMTNSPPQLPSLSTAYQVCPLRPNITSTNYMRTPINQFNQVSYNKTVKVVHQPVNSADLQPSKQPHIYISGNNGMTTPQASVQALQAAVEQGASYKGMNEPPASETNGGYRRFQESMTYRNLTQPLKFSRLASPFPEPVKEMASHKITDQQKSTQMFAESRANAMAQAHFGQRQKQLRLKPQIPIQPSFARHYSDKAFGKAQGFSMPPMVKSNSKKRSVKKIKTDKPCPPVNKSTSCKDNMYVFKPCTKKQAPYPSYSEFCHEDNPMVCRSCPWVSDIHPAFKPKKKNYHTASRAMSMTSGLTTSLEGNSGGSSRDINDVNSISDDGNGSIITMELKKGSRKKPDCLPDSPMQRVPCAWVELDKKEDSQRSNTLKRKKRKQSKVVPKDYAPVEPTDPCKTAGYKSEITQLMSDMIIDASNKGPRERKTQVRCPSKTDENSPPDKRKCTKIPTPSSQPEKMAAATSSHYKSKHPSQVTGPYIPHDVVIPAVGQSIDDWLAGLRPNKMEAHSNVVTSGGPCRKFPFKPFAFDLVINRKPKMRSGKCPKKQKKPLIVDCPQRPAKCDNLAQLFNDVLLFKKKLSGDKCPKDDFKCPQKTPESTSNSGQSKSPPCKNKRVPESQICPDDLLTRKRKDKPWKRAISSNDEDFEEAITMLNSIQKTRSAPSLFIPYNFRQK